MLKDIKKFFLIFSLPLLVSCSSNSDSSSKTVNDIKFISEFLNQQFLSIGEMIDPELAALTCFEGSSSFDNSCTGVENFINTLSFDNCRFIDSNLDPLNPIQERLFGQIDYVYNTSTCQIINTRPANVIQLFDLVLEGRPEGDTRILSQQRPNYLNQSIGGGLSMTVQNLENTFNFDIIGTHKTIINSENQYFLDLSLISLFPILVQGTQRSELAVESGEMEVYDNLNKQTFNFIIHNLNFSPNCKCPTSGTVDGDVTKGANGVFQLEYKTCGDLEITYTDGRKENLYLPACF